MTPPQFAKHYPAISAEENARRTRDRVEARVHGRRDITPPQFAALLRAWKLDKTTS